MTDADPVSKRWRARFNAGLPVPDEYAARFRAEDDELEPLTITITADTSRYDDAIALMAAQWSRLLRNHGHERPHRTAMHAAYRAKTRHRRSR